jgi:hypothetical protein
METTYHIYHGWQGHLSSYPLPNKYCSTAAEALAYGLKHASHFRLWRPEELAQAKWLVEKGPEGRRLLQWIVLPGSQYYHCDKCQLVLPHPPYRACPICLTRLTDELVTWEEPSETDVVYYVLNDGHQEWQLYWTELDRAWKAAEDMLTMRTSCFRIRLQGGLIEVVETPDGQTRRRLVTIVTGRGRGLICTECGTEYPAPMWGLMCPWCNEDQPARCDTGRTMSGGWAVPAALNFAWV